MTPLLQLAQIEGILSPSRYTCMFLILMYTEDISYSTSKAKLDVPPIFDGYMEFYGMTEKMLFLCKKNVVEQTDKIEPKIICLF